MAKKDPQIRMFKLLISTEHINFLSCNTYDKLHMCSHNHKGDNYQVLHINQARHDNSLSIINYLNSPGILTPILCLSNGYDIACLNFNCLFSHSKININ